MRRFNKVAILGSGLMGSQIAAVFANARLTVYLFDQKKLAQQNLEKITTLKPPALVDNKRLDYISPMCYEKDLAQLNSCDLVIEAIIEDLNIKKALFQQIEPYLHPNTILASNTSSLSIKKLAGSLSTQRENFCGIHFFNPARYLSLVELILLKDGAYFAQDLEVFLSSELGKNVLYAQDNTGFIANRIGVFSLASCLHNAQKLGLGLDTVDALTGKRLRRAKSATFRTADLVGLDVLSKVFSEFYHQHNDDPWRDYFVVPGWIKVLVDSGHLGQKTKQGIYQKKEDKIMVYQPKSKPENLQYKTANYTIDSTVKKILKQPTEEQLKQLANCSHPQAKFLHAILSDLFLYASYHLQSIASTPLDIDSALCWGYGWEEGIFAYMQSANYAQHLKTDSVAWLKEVPNFYQKQGVYQPKTKTLEPLFNYKLYHKQLRRQYFLNPFVSQKIEQVFMENNALRYYHENDGIGIVSFKTKMHTLNYELIQSLGEVIDHAQQYCKALLIYQDKPPFCAGADLYEIYAGAKIGQVEQKGLLSGIKGSLWQTMKPKLPKITHLPPINAVIDLLQQTLEKLKFSSIPTIAIVEGLALGGGCELLLHCDRRVVAQESYIGLVEIGVGLLPAGGGCKEMAYRADKRTIDNDLLPLVAQYFKQICLAQISSSAYEALKMGYLDENDLIITQPLESLYHGKQLAKLMIDMGYMPPKKTSIRLAGNGIYASLLAELANMKSGGWISTHDHKVAALIAKTITGGNVAENQALSSDYLLHLERQHFLSLLKQSKTQDRIEYMLTKNKPLRN